MLLNKKYIIIKISGCEVPILFSSFISHDDFLHSFHKNIIVSAGFFIQYLDQDRRDDPIIEVSRGSITLNLKSRPEDVQIIKHFLIGIKQ